MNPPGTGGIFEGTPTVNPEENIMKVVLVNGSPHAKGCTFTALAEVAGELEKNGVETEIFQIGNRPIRGCIACGKCAESCPAHTIRILERKAVIAYPNCIRCFCCHEMCPKQAVDIRRLGIFDL